MFNLSSLIIHTFIIFIAASSPFPTAPFVLNNYKVNGIFFGFIAATIGGLGSGIIHYYFGKFFLKLFIRKRYNFTKRRILKLSKKIRKISFLELTSLMLSAYLPSIIKISACGVARIDLKKMLLAGLIAQFPTQIIFVAASSRLNELEKSFEIITKNNLVSSLLAISVASFFIFLLSLSIRLYPRIFKKIKNIIKI